MNILGISAFYHDSAACLIKDGNIIAAVQEERFSRMKHDESFPFSAIQYCLKEGDLAISDIDYITFYEKPFLKFERLLETYLQYAPCGLPAFLQALPRWIKQKIWIKDIIKSKLGYSGKVLFTEHHESHAASAFFPSQFKEAAILTVDGVGEWATTSYGIGKNNEIQLFAEQKFPHSLGLLYSAFTYYTGFKVNSGEYKLMGLAPYGKPKYKKVIYDNLINVKSDGSFHLNLNYFNIHIGLTMTNQQFHDLFGGPPRIPEAKVTQKDMDIARSIQDVTEEIMVAMARYVKKVTSADYLCLAGGVALNCVANRKILDLCNFKDVWIQPAAGDAGGALGAALLTWFQFLNNPRTVDNNKDMQQGSFLGPQFSSQDIKHFITSNNISAQEVSYKELPAEIAYFLNEGKIVGWFQGRMEFGPRALGARSILADPRSATMQAKLNLKIKFRESFRPFAPAVIMPHAKNYFELDHPSPYMLLVAPVNKKHRQKTNKRVKELFGLDLLHVERSDIPAVTHVDYSARVQTVHKETNMLFYQLIESFYRKYQCPVVINTSFNVRGEPIVCTPEDAYKCFMRTGLDFLILENFILDKRQQKNWTAKFTQYNKLQLD